jgi:8-oxo-dGTP diphosphatase
MSEYPERPVIGVGGVLIHNGRALLIRRAAEPLRGQWSIPGGRLELGETMAEGVARELKEETGIDVRVGELIEVFERIWNEEDVEADAAKPRFHYVIVDYLCEYVSGEPKAGSDALEVAYASEAELVKFELSEAATRVLLKAFEMDRVRRKAR